MPLSNKSIFQGNIIDKITSHFGLHQAIIEPMHILDTSSSCIDLIFTSLPNLSTDSGVHPSLHPNCYHQVVYAKFNLIITYLLLNCQEFGNTKIVILNLFEEQQKTPCVVTIAMICSILTSL